MKKYILILIFIFFILVFSIACLQNNNNEYYNVLIYKNNEQRTGFYDTAGVPVLHGIKWKSKNVGMIQTSPYLYNGRLFPGGDLDIDAKNGEKSWGKRKFDLTLIYEKGMYIGRYIENISEPILIGWDIKKDLLSWKNQKIEDSILFHIHKIFYMLSADMKVEKIL